MRRLTAWIGGVAGGIAAYRFFRRHPQAELEPSPSPEQSEADDRAEELRTKLAESRAAEPVVDDSPPEPVPEEAPRAPEPESPEDRRRRVHEEGRAALDEMHSDGAGD